MSTVHLILQGKGGVGKSFIAALLANISRKKALPCVVSMPIRSTAFRPLGTYPPCSRPASVAKSSPARFGAGLAARYDFPKHFCSK
jgi:hypothetical protein